MQLVDHVGIDTHPAREDHVCKVSSEHDVFAEDADLQVTFSAKALQNSRKLSHVADPNLFHRHIHSFTTVKALVFQQMI